MAKLFQPLAHISSAAQIDNGVITTNPLGAGAVTDAKTSFTAPTRQVLTVGTAATYTTPAGAKRLFVRAVGGGGGGVNGAGDHAGTNGGDTSFNGVVAKGGIGSVTGIQAGPAGGSGGTGAASIRRNGGCGLVGNTSQGSGGAGGDSMLGAGAPATGSNGAGINALANSGGGGSGGGESNPTSCAGGGGGEGFELIITNPAATYTYTVGAGGAGGAASAMQAGGNGGSGVIIVDEFYQ